MAKGPSYRGKKRSKKSKVNPSNMLAQVQQMQEDMKKAQDQLADETFTVTAGGGAISIDISGHERIHSITIEPDLIDPEEPEMLQDMLVAAVNAAIEESQTKAAERMESISGDMGGMGDLLGGLGL